MGAAPLCWIMPIDGNQEGILTALELFSFGRRVDLTLARASSAPHAVF